MTASRSDSSRSQVGDAALVDGVTTDDAIDSPPLASDVRELRPSDIRRTSPHWLEVGQPPTAAYSYQGADFEVFTVKTDAQPWPSSRASKIAEYCRSSRRSTYGGLAPVLDELDEVANVYLVRALYRDEPTGEWCEEWITTRNVSVAEELELYRSASKPEVSIARFLLQAGLASDEAEVHRYTFSNGGTGAIRPTTHTGRRLAANRYSPQSMLVALKQFLDEDDARGNPCRILLFQIPPKLAVHYEILPMTRIDVACGLPSGDLAIDRRINAASDLCYSAPAYFLEAEDTAQFVSGLIADGTVTAELVQRLLPPRRTVNDFLRRSKFSDLRSFGEFFDTSKALSGSRLTPHQLRELANLRVRTAPVPWFFRLPELRRTAERLTPVPTKSVATHARRNDSKLDALEAAVLGAARTSEAWKPEIFDAADPHDQEKLISLLRERPQIRVVDAIGAQLDDLARTELKLKHVPREALEAKVAQLLGGRRASQYGSWIYYPWSEALVHVLPKACYRQLRWDRNLYKITDEEQQTLASKCIAVVGLSVGRSILLNLVQEGVGTHFRLCDLDFLDVSNLNRLRGSGADLGTKKVVLAARELYEQDPYLDIEIFDQGANEENIEQLLAAPIDLLIEECDDLYMKVRLREKARELRVPVLMETGDRGMLDIERFDLEPSRPIFHGLVGDIDARGLRELSTKERVPFILRILDPNRLSVRVAASLAEVEESIYTWPQVASLVSLGGALTCDAARRVLLGQLQASGRYYVDIEQMVVDGAQVELSTIDVAETGAATESRLQRSLPEPFRVDDARVDRDKLEYLVSHAIWAPSGGNVQPWRFHGTSAGLDCHIDADSGSFLDFGGWGQALAIGAAIENICIAAPSIGLKAHVVETAGAGSLAARIQFSACPAQELPLRQQIARRVTNRHILADNELEAEKRQGLQRQAERLGLHLSVVEDSAQRIALGKVLGAADRLRALIEPYHRDLFSELRWNPKEVAHTRTGIDLQSLEMSAADLAGLHVLKRWPVAEFLQRQRLGGALTRSAQKALLGAPAVGLLSAPSGMSTVEGGRRLQRLWLEATALDLAFQPWAPLLAMMARAHAGCELRSDEATAILAQAKQLLSLWALPSGHAPLFIFRILDAPKAPTARSLRLPVASVLRAS